MLGFLIIPGFIFLLKGADMMVDGASAIARRYKVSPLVIGMTIIAFGTSAPELTVNILASFRGNAGLAFGNIIGSNIANILLILGISALIHPIKVQSNTLYREIPFSLHAAVMLLFLGGDVIFDGAKQGILSRSDGLALLSVFAIFIYYVWNLMKKSQEVEDIDIPEMEAWKAILFLILGLLGIALGGDWVVRGAVAIAKEFSVADDVIGLTIIAFGTSLPELAASAVAAYKKQADLAIGNVVGSNIFNIFWVLGLSASIRPLPVGEQNLFDLILLLGVTFLLFGFLIKGTNRTLKRGPAASMVLLYIAYVIYLGLYRL